MNINNENLYAAWEQSRRSDIDGYKGLSEGQQMKLETWVCRPPNVMMFQLQRVTYDKEKQKLVKENTRFEFDKTIYLDLFLNINKEKAEKHQKYVEKTRSDLKIMKDTY